eukprot:5488085-Pyramimonas_sp.AAC.1
MAPFSPGLRDSSSLARPSQEIKPPRYTAPLAVLIGFPFGCRGTPAVEPYFRPSEIIAPSPGCLESSSASSAHRVPLATTCAGSARRGRLSNTSCNITD